jgi:hypothetical protein
MGDLSFIDNMSNVETKRDWREHHRDILREALRHKIELVQDDCDQAVDRARALIKFGGDVTDELKALEEYGQSLQIVVALLRKEASKE